MNSRKQPLFGLMTLVTVFLVLCLTILAVLSYQTAKYERNLAQKNADSASTYYAADAEIIEITDKLYAVYSDGGDLEKAAESLGAVYDEGLITITVRADYARLLVCEIEAQQGFEPNTPRAVPAEEWTADEGITVWDMAE